MACCGISSGGSRVLLPLCKNVERSGERKACLLPLKEKSHKRGYVSVACSGGHQWVWCSSCCDCATGAEGCTFSQHWFERDSFDTGKRNHMQRHCREGGNLLTTITCKDRCQNTKRQREESKADSPPAKHHRPTGPSPLLASQPIVILPPICTRPSSASSGAGNLNPLESVSGPSSFRESTPPNGHDHRTVCTFLDTSSNNSNASLDSSLTAKSLLLSSSRMYTLPMETCTPPPSASTTPEALSSASSPCASPSMSSAGEIKILTECKHMERKHRTSACQCEVSVRLHKRGYLAVRCSAGHQYVWCSCCCDCRGGQGIGCCNPLHWTERDFFDTGKRNHMQRHQPDYDASHDENGVLIATKFPRQVIMPRKSRSPQNSPLSTSPRTDFQRLFAWDCKTLNQGAAPQQHVQQHQAMLPLHIGQLRPSSIPWPVRDLSCLAREALPAARGGMEGDSCGGASALEALADAALSMFKMEVAATVTAM